MSLLYELQDAPVSKLLAKIGLQKKQPPPVIDVVIDPDTDAERFITLQAQEEAHLIEVTPGRHVVAVYDPDRIKHVERSMKSGGIVSGLTGFALGAVLGGSQGTMDAITKGTAKVVVGDAEKRWQKAFERHSVKEFVVQEGETMRFSCWLDADQGIVCLETEKDRARKAFWFELLTGMWVAAALSGVLGVALELDDLPALLLLAAAVAIAAFVVVWKKKQKRESKSE